MHTNAIDTEPKKRGRKPFRTKEYWREYNRDKQREWRKKNPEKAKAHAKKQYERIKQLKEGGK